MTNSFEVWWLLGFPSNGPSPGRDSRCAAWYLWQSWGHSWIKRMDFSSFFLQPSTASCLDSCAPYWLPACTCCCPAVRAGTPATATAFTTRTSATATATERVGPLCVCAHLMGRGFQVCACRLHVWDTYLQHASFVYMITQLKYLRQLGYENSLSILYCVYCSLSANTATSTHMHLYEVNIFIFMLH